MIQAALIKVNMTFKIGDKVRFKWDETEGQVLEVRDDNVSTGAKYLIKWGKNGKPDWEHGDQLRLIDPQDEARVAQQVQDKIDEAKSAMEKAWEAYSAAQDIARQGDYSLWRLMDRELVDMKAFEGVANKFGWETSSLYCS